MDQPKETTENAENTAIIQQKRVIGKPFKPGVSGNPAGKPKGAKNYNTEFRKQLDSMVKGEDGKEMKLSQALLNRILEMGMSNKDWKCLAYVVDRMLGKVKETDDTGDKTLPIPIININFINKDINVLPNFSHGKDHQADEEN